VPFERELDQAVEEFCIRDAGGFEERGVHLVAVIRLGSTAGTRAQG